MSSDLLSLVGRRARRPRAVAAPVPDPQDEPTERDTHDHASDTVSVVSLATVASSDAGAVPPNNDSSIIITNPSGSSLVDMVSRRRRRNVGGEHDIASVRPEALDADPSEQAEIAADPSLPSLEEHKKQRAKERRKLLREGEPAMSRQDACDRARKARSQQDSRSKADSNDVCREAVSQVWREGVALAGREALDADISGRDEVQKGKDVSGGPPSKEAVDGSGGLPSKEAVGVAGGPPSKEAVGGSSGPRSKESADGPGGH